MASAKQELSLSGDAITAAARPQSRLTPWLALASALLAFATVTNRAGFWQPVAPAAKLAAAETPTPSSDDRLVVFPRSRARQAPGDAAWSY